MKDALPPLADFFPTPSDVDTAAAIIRGLEGRPAHPRDDDGRAVAVPQHAKYIASMKKQGAL